MGVTAHCTDCDDRHPVGDRPTAGGTTACPDCSSKSYRSIPDETGSTPTSPVRSKKSEEKRIRDAVKDVSGVGEETIEILVERCGTYEVLEQATVDELVDVKNVGTTVAQRIVDKTN